MSVYKRKDSPFYHYDFQYRGNRFYGSTGETDRRKAERFEADEKKRLKEQKSRGGDKAGAMILDIAAERYWNEVGQYSKEKDLEENIARLVSRIGPQTTLAEITNDIVAQQVARRRGDYRHNTPKLGLLSNGTVNRTVTQLLRRILTRAKKAWNIPLPDEPDWSAHTLDEPRERIREMSFTEEEIIEETEREDYTAVRKFAVASGLRKRGLVSLTWPQVDWHARIIRAIGKGDKIQIIPITTEIANILWPLRGHHETHVFTFVAQRTYTNKKNGQHYVKGKRYPITYEGWSTQFRRMTEKGKIEDLRIHDLRHTTASRTLRASKNLRAVQNLLGHSDIKTTMRYAHALLDDVAEAMEARVTDEAARREMHKRHTESRDNPEINEQYMHETLSNKGKRHA